MQAITIILVLVNLIWQVRLQTGVYLSLNGEHIANNSYVDIDSIGTNDTGALLCHTDKIDCSNDSMSSNETLEGDWYYPNGSVVGMAEITTTNNISSPPPFASNRGQSVIHLFKTTNNYSATESLGLFHCVVPDANDTNQNLYIHILDFGQLTISPRSPVTVVSGQTPVSLQCSFDIANNFLPPNVPSLVIVWFCDTTNLTHLSETTNTETNNTISYTSTLQLSSVMESDAGVYMCQIKGNERFSTSTQISTFSLQISDNGATPIIGKSYNLICIVTANVTSYRWRRNGEIISNETEEALVFPSLRLSDAGNYSCEVMFGKNVTTYRSNNMSIIIKIPDPLSVILTSDKVNPIRPVGSDVTLSCTVMLDQVVESYDLVTARVHIILNTYTNEDSTIEVEPIEFNNTYASATLTFPFGRSKSGYYTCTATLLSFSTHLEQSRTVMSNRLKLTTGVYLSLNGEALRNNSVLINDEGGFTSSFVFPVCHTDNPECCDEINSGRWYGPDGNANTLHQFTVNTSDEGTVMLAIRNSEYVSRNGQYCCTVADIEKIYQTVCFTSGPAVSINAAANVAIGYDFVLNCNVLGLSITTYEWTKDGVLLDETGTTLLFSPLRLCDAGQYTCTVNSTHSDAIGVMLEIPSQISVTLTSNTSNPITLIGSDVTLTCTVELSPLLVGSNLSLLMVDVQLSKDGTTLALTGPTVTGSTFTYTVKLVSFARNDSGIYVCTANVQKQPNSIYLTGNIPETMDTIPLYTGVYINLHGVVVFNNSEISYEDIRETDNGALLCFTDLDQLCRDMFEHGNWYFPNNSVVGASGDMYTTRGCGVVRLHRRSDATVPTGRFHCEMPDVNRTNQTIFVEINNNRIDTTVNQKSNTASSFPVEVAIAGSSVGGLILISTGLLLVIFVINRLRIQKKECYHESENFESFENQKPHHNTRNSEFIESEDLSNHVQERQTQQGGKNITLHDFTNFPPEQATQEDVDKNENIELDEYDGTKKDEESNDHFKETLATAEEGSRPIPVSEFCAHVEKLCANTDGLFIKEYVSISRKPQLSISVAQLPQNKLKNRFANILPYDSTRVTLQEIDGEENSDYINASYLHGYNKAKAYVGAQGPLPNTVSDFWRMIWENKLPTIVMLTRVFEGKVKCEHYWPEKSGNSVYPGHNLTVTLTSVQSFAEFSIRNLTITSSREPASQLNVIQFHFTSWPDHGVPQNGIILINFIKRVRAVHPYSDSRPLLVHCSAGVGRTGTFIVLDSMLERMKVEDTLNVYEFVKKLRTQRVQTVQTQAQYNFIHNVLNELILTGETEITAPNVRIIINQLSTITDTETGYSRQFKILDQVSPKSGESDYTQATKEGNIQKNRYPTILPNNHYRVMLRAAGDLDYINASFIDGYMKRRAYIATQIPMENTVNDFWKMIWEYQCRSIVTLCKMTEDGQIYPNYLPESMGSSVVYGKVTVKMVSQETLTDYATKELELSQDKSSETVTAVVFHYLHWPRDGTPQETSGLLHFIAHLDKRQMSSGNKPIAIMCNDGIGRTGTFICIHAQLERLKTEGIVDFFQSIKSARIHRAGLVSHVNQYIFCHRVVSDYLDGFDTYANFKEFV